MRKTLLFMIFFCVHLLNAQENRIDELTKIEEKISTFISKNIDNFNLNELTETKLKNDYQKEIKKHGYTYKVEDLNKIIINYKKRELRKKYFNKNPLHKELFEKPIIDTQRQICVGGDFESGNPNSYFTFKEGEVNNSFNTNTSDFLPFIANNTLINVDSEDFNSSITNIGFDRDVPLIRKVNNGSKAIMLSPKDSYQAITMSKTFVVNEANLNFKYALIMLGVNDHLENDQAFFSVRIYNSNNQIISQYKMSAIPNRELFVYSQDNYKRLFYKPWDCKTFNLSRYIGQEITIEFIAGNSSLGDSTHFSRVYIDDICSSTCEDSEDENIGISSIKLNPIETIFCPKEKVFICGTYVIEENATVSSSNFKLVIPRDGYLDYEIHNPTLLENNSFCFEVPIEAFGSTPNGTYEFIVTMQINGNEYVDYSANDNGPDVLFENCIEANDDTLEWSSCNLNLINVLSNDKINGLSLNINLHNIQLTQLSTTSPLLNIDPNTGILNIDPAIVNGTYTLTYKICQINNPNNCDTASVTINIINNKITSGQKSVSINGTVCKGGVLNKVLSHFLYCNNALNIDSATFQITDNGGIEGLYISNNNSIIVPPNTPIGIYGFYIQVCLINNPEICLTRLINVKITPDTSVENSIFKNLVTEICKGDNSIVLPTVSTNGAIGTWYPSEVNSQETTTYTFTPNSNCFKDYRHTIIVKDKCTYNLIWDGDFSCRIEENIIDKGLHPAPVIERGSEYVYMCQNIIMNYSISGIMSNIRDVVWNVTGGEVNNSSTNGAEIYWNWEPYGTLECLITLNDNSVVRIIQFIHKVIAPTARFEILPYNDIFCSGGEVNFNNLSTNNEGNPTLYYMWDFGDGNVSSEQNPSHTYETEGEYEVTLKVHNGCSCYDEFTQKVKISNSRLKIICPSIVCENEITTLSIENINGCNVNWEIIGGHIISSNHNSSQVEIIWDEVDDNGYGYVTVVDSCSGCSSTLKIPVIKNKALITGETSICMNEQYLYTLPSWVTTVYDWELVDELNLGGQIFVSEFPNKVYVKARLSGTLKLRVTYKNTLKGCTGFAELDIYVKPNTGINGPSNVCLGDTYQYTIVNSNNELVSVNWYIRGYREATGFVLRGNGNTIDINFPTVGSYYISFDSVNDCFRSEKVINVKTITPNLPRINGPSLVCANLNQTYSINLPTGYTAEWEVINGTILGSNTDSNINVKFDYLNHDEYIVKVRLKNGACLSDYIVLPVRKDRPVLNFTQISASVCTNSRVQYKFSNTNLEKITWKIFPETAGSIESGQGSNNIIILWNNEDLQNAQIEIKTTKCAIEYTEIISVQIVDSLPISITSSSDSACVGLPITFRVNGIQANNYSSIFWDFGDGNGPVEGGISISHRFQQPITSQINRNIIVTVNGINGCISASIATKDIILSPSPNIEISPNNINLCDTQTRTITLTNISGFGSISNIQWYKDNNPINYYDLSLNVDSINLGVGRYYARVTNEWGCTISTATSIISNNCSEVTPTCVSNLINGYVTNTACNLVTVTIDEFSPNPLSTEITVSGYESYATSSIEGANRTFENLPVGDHTANLRAIYEDCITDKRIRFKVPYKT